MKTGRLIEANRASIETASVSINTIMIDKRQMTLSLFRQLVKEPLIDWQTGKLLGSPWGWVNYFWGECTDDHKHVIFQREGYIRRACVVPLEGYGGYRQINLSIIMGYERDAARAGERASSYFDKDKKNKCLKEKLLCQEEALNLRRALDTIAPIWERSFQAILSTPQLFISG